MKYKNITLLKSINGTWFIENIKLSWEGIISHVQIFISINFSNIEHIYSEKPMIFFSNFAKKFYSSFGKSSENRFEKF